MKIEEKPRVPPSRVYAAQQERTQERKQQEVKTEQKQQVVTKELQRSFEVQTEPTLTVLKFTNPVTKEIEMQVPSETQIKTYQNMLDYLKKQER